MRIVRKRDVPTHTPKEVSPKILELCHQIAGDDAQPVFIDVTPESGCGTGNSFANVRRKVEQEGGRIQLGWALWEWSGVLVEAELHAVYVPPNSQSWLDITPCERGSSKRLFLLDDKAPYDFGIEDSLHDNRRLALNDDPMIGELFEAEMKRTAFLNKLPQGGASSIHPSEAQQFQKIERRIALAMSELATKYGSQGLDQKVARAG